jgi:acetyl esterase/lipase
VPQRSPHRRTLLAALAVSAALVLAACAPAPAGIGSERTPPPVPDEVGVAYGPDPDHLLDVYRTTATERRGTIVFVHGGGWTQGSRAELTGGSFDLVLAQLARGYDLVSVDYRLAPDHLFPAALADVGLALTWVATDGGALGLDTSRLVVVGHSAGGSLAAMVGTSPGLATEFGTIPRVDRWVALAAMSSFAAGGMVSDFPSDWGLRDLSQRIMASPVTTLDAGDPPGYLIHGDRDGFVADGHSIVMAAHARTIGAQVQLDHITTGSPECRTHLAFCSADQSALERFLDGPVPAPASLD